MDMYIPYIIQPGDTLTRIANRFNVSLKKIIMSNYFREDLNIFPGRIIFIPKDTAPRDESLQENSTIFDYFKYPSMKKIYYVVQPGDTLSTIANRYDSTVDAIMVANCLISDVIYPGQILLIPIINF